MRSCIPWGWENGKGWKLGKYTLQIKQQTDGASNFKESNAQPISLPRIKQGKCPVFSVTQKDRKSCLETLLSPFILNSDSQNFPSAEGFSLIMKFWSEELLTLASVCPVAKWKIWVTFCFQVCLIELPFSSAGSAPASVVQMMLCSVTFSTWFPKKVLKVSIHQLWPEVW